ncbi:MAG TPA: substrate-binding domain-containing protein [Methylomirabilota bacterium]|jgi:molybdate transport system substrate-binding protein|nr:substrate-binding domain-containing protein [Methylomirabilota bacterium]
MTRALGMALALLALSAARTDAAEIKLLCAGAMRTIVSELGADFTRETGHTLALTAGTAGQLRDKVLAGEPMDVLVVTDTVVDQLIRQGQLAPGSRVDLARTGMGVAVREGAPKPDISTPEALKQALLSAKSIAYVDPASGGTSGIHFASVLQRLGIADAVRGKTTLRPGGFVAELVARGEVEMVVHQISEILPVKGVTLVGPLPRDLQKVTVYSAALPARGTTEPAKALVEFLARPALKPKFAAAGLDYKD